MISYPINKVKYEIDTFQVVVFEDLMDQLSAVECLFENLADNLSAADYSFLDFS